eukprot:TRINITY_DN215_c0_g1_i1.p1 TRINITY_DN215_c0_g1~~TRINITY_DN215_c0_g1_i1.p1  ORF type:complete len:341 (+),score=63.61 TRINITY_DN215_c0_g1_i1:81-1103(+)
MTAVDGFIGSIGNTPLIELKSLSRLTGRRILAKAEHMNPGGSVKDRAAKWLVEDAERKGLLKPGGTIVEGTGGNTGIGLSLVGRAKGYKTVMVMPENIAVEKIDMMRLLGSEVILQPAVPFKDERHYYHTAARIASERENAVFTNQFESLANAQAHIESTGPEIWQQSGHRVDGFVCSAGTGGTIGGLSRYFRSMNPDVKAYLIDPMDSVLYNYMRDGSMTMLGKMATTEGIGIARLTANFQSAQLDGAFCGTDREVMEMLYFLLRNEGVLVGPSSALNVCGAVKLARLLPEGATVVTILCDMGERYKSKVFDRKWQESKELVPVLEGADDISFVLPPDQ